MAEPTLAEVIEQGKELQAECNEKQEAFFDARSEYREAAARLEAWNAKHGPIVRQVGS